MGDFTVRTLRREGLRAVRGWLNVKFSAFHEGRGAGKTDPPGGSLEKECLDNCKRKESYDSNPTVPANSSRACLESRGHLYGRLIHADSFFFDRGG